MGSTCIHGMHREVLKSMICNLNILFAGSMVNMLIRGKDGKRI